MKNSKVKFEYVILGIVIIGLLAYLVFRNPDRIQYELPEIEPVSDVEITKIEIQQPESSITLEKANEKWLIHPQGYPVDPQKIDRIKSSISDMVITDVISESESYAKYGLDRENRIVARVHDKNGLRHTFHIGKQAATYRHTYVKLGNDPRVFHAQDSFRSHFDETVDSLRDKTVMSFDQNEIREIHLITEAQEMVFSKAMEKAKIKTETPEAESQPKEQPEQGEKSREQEVWVLPDGQRGKTEELKSILREMSNLRCSAFLEGKSRKEFNDPIYRILLKGNNDHTLKIFPQTKEDDDSYPAISSDTPYMFSLTAPQAERLMKKPEDVLEKNDGK